MDCTSNDNTRPSSYCYDETTRTACSKKMFNKSTDRFSRVTVVGSSALKTLKYIEMKSSLSLGKIAGIRLYIHWTFPIILIWIIFSNLRSGFSTEQVIWSVLFILSLFVCVTLHELGHALAARRYHIQTRDITLYPIGGVARLEKIPERPMHEFIVALAGPAVNFILVILLAVVLQLAHVPIDFSSITHIGPDNFLLNLAVINGWLAVFNLIPAFPMDGGRVLRALLSFRLSRVRATHIASTVGQIIAVAFIFFGFFNNPFLVFIGLFVFLGAKAEAQMVTSESILKGRTADDFVMKEIPMLQINDSVGNAAKALLNGQAKNFLVMNGDTPAGTLNRDGIISALQQSGSETQVRSAMDKNLIYIEASDAAEKVFSLLHQYKHTLLVVRKNNQLHGVIDLENVIEFVNVINASKNSGNVDDRPI